MHGINFSRSLDHCQGPPNRSVFILAHAPLVTEDRVIGVYKRETVGHIVERGDCMVSRMSIGVPRGSVLLVYVNRTFYILLIYNKWPTRG